METFLLLVTCAWIIYEGIERLIRKHAAVDASFWAFAVIVVSIMTDFSRSRVLFRAARKYNSQALEADALHFSTDIWSSAVVLPGLVGVRLAGSFPAYASVLEKADSVAALGVAAIVVFVCLRLGSRKIRGHLDTAPEGLREKIKESVEALPGVTDCHNVRVRTSGPYLFVDVHVLVDGEQTLNAAHAQTEVIEQTIQKLAPNADVTVHPEPSPPPQRSERRGPSVSS